MADRILLTVLDAMLTPGDNLPHLLLSRVEQALSATQAVSQIGILAPSHKRVSPNLWPHPINHVPLQL